MLHTQGVSCIACTFRSPSREESHWEGSESQFCNEHKPARARQGERFCVNYCSVITFVESVISKAVCLHKAGLLFQAEGYEKACRILVAHQMLHITMHGDLNLRPIPSKTVRYSPFWFLGNQDYVYWWWTCSQDFGMDQDGKLLPALQGTCDGLVGADGDECRQ